MTLDFLKCEIKLTPSSTLVPQALRRDWDARVLHGASGLGQCLKWSPGYSRLPCLQFKDTAGYFLSYTPVKSPCLWQKVFISAGINVVGWSFTNTRAGWVLMLGNRLCSTHWWGKTLTWWFTVQERCQSIFPAKVDSTVEYGPHFLKIVFGRIWQWFSFLVMYIFFRLMNGCCG